MIRTAISARLAAMMRLKGGEADFLAGAESVSDDDDSLVSTGSVTTKRRLFGTVALVAFNDDNGVAGIKAMLEVTRHVPTTDKRAMRIFMVYSSYHSYRCN